MYPAVYQPAGCFIQRDAAVSAGSVTFWPVEFTTKAYEFALTGGSFFSSLWVAIQRTVIGTVVNLVLIVLTAYPLSKSKQKLMGRNIYMGFFIITMLFSGGLIPTYLVVVKMGLIDSIWSLILPGALPVFSMIILMNFIRGRLRRLKNQPLSMVLGLYRYYFVFYSHFSSPLSLRLVCSVSLPTGIRGSMALSI